MNAHSKTKDVSKAYVPKAYQTGIIDFYGQDFIVTPDVLIPRPETEQLIDEVLSLAGKSILPGVKPTENVLPDNPIILDVGTGSGCIAITLKRLLPDATIYASDISEKALAVAQKNASRQNIPIHTIISNLLEFVNSQACDDPKGGHQNACGSKILGEEGRQDPPVEQYLYAVVQGGTFNDLRAESARYCASKNVDGFGIGGVFTADGMAEMLQVVNSILPENKPRHLLGMGEEPIDLFDGAENGCDTFDCVGPTRMARNGSLYTLDGRINIKNAKFKEDFSPLMTDCDCELCRHHTRAYLHHLFRTDEITAKVLASIHNERFVVRTVDNIRESLLNGTFESYKRDFLARYYHK